MANACYIRIVSVFLRKHLFCNFITLVYQGQHIKHAERLWDKFYHVSSIEIQDIKQHSMHFRNKN